MLVAIPPGLEDVLDSSSDTLHGAARFKGTRVFAQSLFDYVMKGKSVEVFLDHFPDVSRHQAEALLRWEDRVAAQRFSQPISAHSAQTRGEAI